MTDEQKNPEEEMPMAAAENPASQAENEPETVVEESAEALPISDAVQEAEDAATEALSEAEDAATEAVSEVEDAATEAVSEAEDAATEAVSEAEDAATEAVSEAEDAATEVVSEVEEKAAEAQEKAAEAVSEAQERAAAAAGAATAAAGQLMGALGRGLQSVAANMATEDVDEESANDPHSDVVRLPYIGYIEVYGGIYTVIFAVLAVLTVLEVAVAEIFPSGFVSILALLGAAVAKAALVVAYYMHLKNDNPIFRVVLLLPVLVVLLSVLYLIGVPTGAGLGYS